ncbi:hypothetical protein [Phaeodactylibacter xiamenensis]|uniref:hypothetical protein n=1 Tax=Phaeodactylibacter xiamenensis TaxID=1524460 RepID=UPI003CCB8B4D
MNAWFDEIVSFSNKKKALFTKEVNERMNLLSYFRKSMNYLIQNNPINDRQLKNFAIKYHSDIEDIFSNVEHSIVEFFEKKISLNFKFGNVDKKALKKIEDEIYGYSIIKDNFKR